MKMKGVVGGWGVGVGVHSIPVYRGEGNNLAINEEKKNRSYWKILKDINHTLNNNSYCGIQTSKMKKISRWFL